jgi:ADP-ribose pyrophosphatase YjhB (NUDIX family)
MENKTNPPFMRTYVSVDCVLFGFDGSRLNVLLVERNTAGHTEKGLKLPGSLIYQEEDADRAAHRVLNELTGIKKMTQKQFKSFTSPERASDPADIAWLEIEYSSRIERLITIAYLSLCKINRKLNVVSKYRTVEWIPLNRLPKMPFDHNQIVEESLNEIRSWVEYDPAVIFELLPSKFTAAELRQLFEAIHRTRCDVRNFHKKILSTEYIVPLEEKQQGVSHRAARFYRFDKKLYKKTRGN